MTKISVLTKISRFGKDFIFPRSCIFGFHIKGGLISNASTYGTKYVEEVYGVSTATAAMSAGAVVVLSGALGQTLGGVWVGKANPTVRKQIIFAVSMLLISLARSKSKKSFLCMIK